MTHGRKERQNYDKQDKGNDNKGRVKDNQDKSTIKTRWDHNQDKVTIKTIEEDNQDKSEDKQDKRQGQTRQ